MKFGHRALLSALLVLGCAAPVMATDVWVADWDMNNGLAELRQGSFKNAVMFAAYFTPQGRPFLSDDMKKALHGGLLASFSRPGSAASESLFFTAFTVVAF